MFYSEKFSFNGIENDEMDIILVTSGNVDILNDYGNIFIDTIKQSSVYGDSPYYLKDKDEYEEIELEFAYVNSVYEPQIWDEDKLKEVIDWLYTDDFCPFISYDNDEITYYLKATKISKYFNNEMRGMLKVTFQMYTHYGYKYLSKSLRVEGEGQIKIINDSNIKDEFYFPVIEITQLAESGDIEILNETISEDALVIKGLNKEERIIIDNGNFVVQDEKGNNKFSLINRKWIKLRKDKNNISIKGNCNITIKCNFPYIV